jgi:MFS family permease
MFLGAWNFAVNIAAPFFTVYMLKRLHLSMSVIIALSVLSQIVNVIFIRLWGILADRFSNKSVLLVTCTMFVLTTAIWPFTTMPAAYFLTIPLVVSIHAFAGISSAGIMLCTGNIAMELAPIGKSTAYLAVNALVSGFMATIASILGGVTATLLEGQRLSLTFRWLSMESLRFEIYAMDLKGLDFLFVFSCLLGMYAVHRLLAVKEKGEVQADVVIDQFRIEVKKAAANVTNIEGLLDLIYFPYASLRELLHDEEMEDSK